MNKWLSFGAFHGFVAVALGAFGAHALKASLAPDKMAIFETGARYEMFHALALLGLAALASKFSGKVFETAGWCLALGTTLFSFSLYILVITGEGRWGIVTPFGGLGLLAGWALLGIVASQSDLKG
jgi:uncharacterized membrane protein YgdD (TMEM256/DUF423 family)